MGNTFFFINSNTTALFPVSSNISKRSNITSSIFSKYFSLTTESCQSVLSTQFKSPTDFFWADSSPHCAWSDGLYQLDENIFSFRIGSFLCSLNYSIDSIKDTLWSKISIRNFFSYMPYQFRRDSFPSHPTKPCYRRT